MNGKQISEDDPRITAYALNEMEPAERGEFERLLHDDPAAQRLVEEIRATVPALERALAGESPGEEQPGGLPARPAGKRSRRNDDLPKVVRFPYYWVAGLAAACFAVGFVVWQAGYLQQEQVRYTEVDLTKLVPADAAQSRPADAAATPAGKPADGQPVIEVGLVPEVPAKGREESSLAQAAATAGAVSVALPVAAAGADAAESKKEPVPGLTAQVLAESRATRGAAPMALADAQGVAGSSPTVSAPTAAPTVAPANIGQRLPEEKTVALSPFKVEADKEEGYFAATTIAGTRLNTELRDIGSAVRTMPADMPQDRLMPPPAPEPRSGFNTEAYDHIADNSFRTVRNEPLSTFSIDVDTAAYANVRRFIQGGQRPPRDAVRIEELVNYFPYDYAAPTAKEVPFAASMEVASAPWQPGHRLVRIGLKGREVPVGERGPANLVFLLDVSGSMRSPNKLPLVQESLRLLVDKLRDDDRVAIVVYAGASGLALPSTRAADRREILDAIDSLRAGGSTNGAMGIRLAYDIAKANFVEHGINRIVLCTDGDFNVGVTNRGDLVRLVEEKAKTGVFLTVLGFGMGNLKDAALEQLADKGNGNYGYVDSRREAQKLLVEQAGGTLVTIAKDVKIQVEFNPAQVQAYRLIGYENRLLRNEDFNNDRIDAGEIGAGHTVTALYEVVPAGAEWQPEAGVDDLKYQKPAAPMKLAAGASDELLTLKLRYKAPDGDASRLLEFPLRDSGTRFDDASADFKFAAAVASFGMILRDSPHKGGATLADVSTWAAAGAARDPGGYRSEFLGLVKQTESLVR